MARANGWSRGHALCRGSIEMTDVSCLALALNASPRYRIREDNVRKKDYRLELYGRRVEAASYILDILDRKKHIRIKCHKS